MDIQKKTDFELLKEEIDRGMAGRNTGIPMGFNRLNKYIGIRKRIYTLVFGPTGSGKSSLAFDAWILNPFEYYISQTEKKQKIKVLLFSMERSKVYTLAKWLSRKIFLDRGELVPVPKLLGWWDSKLTHNEHDLVLLYQDYIERLTEEFVDIIEGAQNPTGIYRYIKNYAENNGKVEHINEFKKIYLPNDEDEIVIPIIDHLGLTKLEKGLTSKKEAIDKVSEHLQFARDFYGYTPVAVSQITRDLGSVMYQKLGDFEPTIDHVKESGRVAEDVDTVLSIFDPLRYNTQDSQYEAVKFVNQNTGAKHFRSIKLLKSTYSEDSIKISMAFWGACGTFKELPKAKDVTEKTYEDVISGNYFLQ